MRSLPLLPFLLALVAARPLPAVEERFCPEDSGICIDTVLSIRFIDTGTSEIRGVRVGQEIAAKVTIDVKDEGIAGFCYGLEHDPAVLEIVQPSSEECSNDPLKCNPTFYGMDLVLMECTDLPLGSCGSLTDDHQARGFIFAAILIKEPKQLPPGVIDYFVTLVRYLAVADPGPMGTKIFFSNDLAPPGSPPASLNLTTGGKSKQPRIVRNGLVFGAGGEVGFSRADCNGDGKVNIADLVVLVWNLFLQKLVFFDCQEMLDVNDDGILNTGDPLYLITYLFLHGPKPPEPFGTCGADPTPDSLGCNGSNCR